MYGIIDCDNCYVSCERVFRPDLKDKPVVVLSNNDGCVVARSNEAKKMGIKAGTPYFQLAEQFPNQKIVVFSSNYELYGELTSRVVSIISKEAPAYFRYSIDECFVYLDGMEKIDLKAWGEELLGARSFIRKSSETWECRSVSDWLPTRPLQRWPAISPRNTRATAIAA